MESRGAVRHDKAGPGVLRPPSAALGAGSALVIGEHATAPVPGVLSRLGPLSFATGRSDALLGGLGVLFVVSDRQRHGPGHPEVPPFPLGDGGPMDAQRISQRVLAEPQPMPGLLEFTRSYAAYSPTANPPTATGPG